MQVGEATSTTLRGFTVCGEGQLHDLHSKLLLNHPEGQAKQLHKYAPVVKPLHVPICKPCAASLSLDAAACDIQLSFSTILRYLQQSDKATEFRYMSLC